MSAKTQSSQDFVPIREVRDGVVLLKDGGMRAILMTSSLNFALKSADGQQSIIFQFQNLLNSLDFSIQFFIQSRRLDIRPYIALLESNYKEQKGELFKLQTREYIEFIKNFTDNASIMTKSFFVVIPYSSAVLSPKKTSAIKGFFRKKDEKTKESSKEKVDQFDEARSQLSQRVHVVEQGLTRSGIRVIRLGTEEIIELFYRIFNPGDTEKPIKIG